MIYNLNDQMLTINNPITQNKALNSQFATNMHPNKQLAKCEHVHLNINCISKAFKEKVLTVEMNTDYS